MRNEKLNENENGNENRVMNQEKKIFLMSCQINI